MSPKTIYDWGAVDWALNDHAIAATLGCTHWTVARWRKRLGKQKGPKLRRSDAGIKRPGTGPAHSRLVQPLATAAAKLSPRAGRGVDNFRAKDWALISPDGTAYEFRNLYEFIRQNPELFAPADVEWKRLGGERGKGGEYCNASAGLLNISGGKTKGWKGWRMGGPTRTTAAPSHYDRVSVA